MWRPRRPRGAQTIVSVGERTSDSVAPRSRGIGGLAPAVAMSAKRRFLHDDEAGVFQMPPDPVAGNLGREFVAIVHPLSPAKCEGEGDGLGQIVRISGGELFGGVGHCPTIARQ